MTTDKTQELSKLNEQIDVITSDFAWAHVKSGDLDDVMKVQQNARKVINDWHNKQVEETMAKFHLEKGVKYDVKSSDSVIVITHSNKLKENK